MQLSPSGTLAHTEVDASRKSTAAYLAEEFTLLLPSGERRVLRPTKDVTRDALLDLVGRRVTVTATWHEGTEPDPMMAAPMGADGPMRHGAGWRVASITAD